MSKEMSSLQCCYNVKIISSRKHQPEALLKRRRHRSAAGAYDYIYDPAYIVTNEKDFARARYKAAVATAKLRITTNFETMFSDRSHRPFTHVYQNNDLPSHADMSFEGALERSKLTQSRPAPLHFAQMRPQLLISAPNTTRSLVNCDQEDISVNVPPAQKARISSAPVRNPRSKVQDAKMRPKSSTAAKSGLNVNDCTANKLPKYQVSRPIGSYSVKSRFNDNLWATKNHVGYFQLIQKLSDTEEKFQKLKLNL